MFPKIMGFPPKSSILIGFSILTIHFGGFPPIFWNTHIGIPKNTLNCYNQSYPGGDWGGVFWFLLQGVGPWF